MKSITSILKFLIIQTDHNINPDPELAIELGVYSEDFDIFTRTKIHDICEYIEDNHYINGIFNKKINKTSKTLLKHLKK